MKKSYSPYRQRFAWWTNPWVVVLVSIEFAVAAFFFIYIYWLVGLPSAVALGGFFCFIPFLTLYYFKNAFVDPNHSIDHSVVESTREELGRHRVDAKRAFQATELALLREGKRIPVLESLRLDVKARNSHPYYSAVQVAEIDPAVHEFALRLIVGSLSLEGDDAKALRMKFLNAFRMFLRAYFQEPDLVPLLPFFNTAIVEAYALREDASGHDISYPILSFSFRKDSLKMLHVSSNADDLRALGEFRFDDGKTIEPHRGIVGPEDR